MDIDNIVEQAKEEKKKEIAENLVWFLSIDKIAEVTDMDIEEVKDIKSKNTKKYLTEIERRILKKYEKEFLKEVSDYFSVNQHKNTKDLIMDFLVEFEYSDEGIEYMNKLLNKYGHGE